MNPGPAVWALCGLLLAPRIAAAELPLNGITIGTSVGAVARTLGTPANVTSADNGNRFEFPGATAYADDDGIVLAIDLRTGNPRIDVDGTVRTFPIGVYSGARADAELADVAEFATPAVRSYRLAPRRDLVLGFAESTDRLERVTFGEPGQLARLGLLPGDAAAKAVVYRAPQPRRADTGDSPAGSQTSVYRVAIDRAGAVRSVDVIIPSLAPDRDAELALQLRTGRYIPATLGGRPIGATIFVELRH